MERIFTFAPRCSKTDGESLVFNEVTYWVEGYFDSKLEPLNILEFPTRIVCPLNTPES